MNSYVNWVTIKINISEPRHQHPCEASCMRLCLYNIAVDMHSISVILICAHALISQTASVVIAQFVP